MDRINICRELNESNSVDTQGSETRRLSSQYELENHVIHLFFYPQSLACANKIHFQMRFILMLKDFDLLPNKPAFH